MERERHSLEADGNMHRADGAPSGDRLEQARNRTRPMFERVSRAFDNINSIYAHTYLEQNNQTGAE